MKKNSKEPQPLFQKAMRYHQNAKEILKDVPIEYGLYTDAKPVQEAGSICYLAVLKTLDGFFLQRGILAEKFPKSADGYRDLVNRYGVKNGKLRAAFEIVYQLLHVRFYYGGTTHVETIKTGFQKARFVIETMAGRGVQ